MTRPWRWPLLLAGLTAAGLLSAIFGDGAWDVACWLALAVPIAVIAIRLGQQIKVSSG